MKTKPFKLVIIAGIERLAYYYDSLEKAILMYDIYKTFPDVDDIFFDGSIGG